MAYQFIEHKYPVRQKYMVFCLFSSSSFGLIMTKLVYFSIHLWYCSSLFVDDSTLLGIVQKVVVIMLCNVVPGDKSCSRIKSQRIETVGDTALNFIQKQGDDKTLWLLTDEEKQGKEWLRLKLSDFTAIVTLVPLCGKSVIRNGLRTLICYTVWMFKHIIHQNIQIYLEHFVFGSECVVTQI